MTAPKAGEQRSVTLLRIEWENHDHEGEPDWAYHLRMGDIDCDTAEVIALEQMGRQCSRHGQGCHSRCAEPMEPVYRIARSNP